MNYPIGAIGLPPPLIPNLPNVQPQSGHLPPQYIPGLPHQAVQGPYVPYSGTYIPLATVPSNYGPLQIVANQKRRTTVHPKTVLLWGLHRLRLQLPGEIEGFDKMILNYTTNPRNGDVNDIWTEKLKLHWQWPILINAVLSLFDGAIENPQLAQESPKETLEDARDELVYQLNLDSPYLCAQKTADSLEGILSACPTDFSKALEMYLTARDALLASAAQQQQYGFGQTTNICPYHSLYAQCPFGKECNKWHRCSYCKYPHGILDCNLSGLKNDKNKRALVSHVKRPKTPTAYSNTYKKGFNRRRSRGRGQGAPYGPQQNYNRNPEKNSRSKPRGKSKK